MGYQSSRIAQIRGAGNLFYLAYILTQNMNKQEQQYNAYLTKLGYTPKFYPEKSMFYVDEHKMYLKCCPYPASDELKNHAAKASKDFLVVLLEGNLTFGGNLVFQDGGQMEVDCVLLKSGSKYGAIFYGEFGVEYFEDESVAIAYGIIGKDLTCKRCKKVNDYTIQKNLHYKATCKCGTFLTNISTNKPPVIHFGKYAGRTLESMTSDEELRYLQWACDNDILSKKLKESALSFIKSR